MLNSTLSDKGIFRMKDWWWSKVALMMGMVYLFTAWFEILPNHFPVLALLSITSIAGFASFGYLINDFFDIEKDVKAGKKNFLVGKSSISVIAYFLLSGSFMMLPWSYFQNTRYSAVIVITELILFLIYSMPPIRLKERGVLGLIVDALYAHAIPVVLICYTYSLEGEKPFSAIAVLLLFIWQTLAGLRNILLHQADDIQSDRKTNVNNFVARLSSDTFHTTIGNLILYELFFGLLFFTVITIANPAFVLCAATMAIISVRVFGLFRLKGIERMLKSSWKYFPNNIYEKWLPVCSLLILAHIHAGFYAVLLLHLALFNSDFYVQTFKILYPLLRDGVVQGIIIPGKEVSSFLINHFIYYLLLIFGIDLRKEKISAVEYFKKKNSKNGDKGIQQTISEATIFQSKLNYKGYQQEWKSAAKHVLEKKSDSGCNHQNIFVFVVCGAKEHIDALHYSIGTFKKYSSCKIIVITDSSRNETVVAHNTVIDIKTPANLSHHQASIYLKTGIHRFVPAENLYCYLDTDVVALSNRADDIFNQYVPPIMFAPDHCVMDKFSPAAMNCGCMGQPDRGTELRALFKKYKHLTRQPENEEKKKDLLQKLEDIKKSKLYYGWISLKFNLSRYKFRLDEDNFLDKEKQFWHDREGNAILYEKEDNAIAEIERTTDFRCDIANNHYWTIHGKAVFDCRCNHLAEAIEKTFGINVTEPKWQHWNGGVFLFDDRSHAFLDAWHEKTMHIFTLKEWKTRDQGTLIATVWQMGLQNHLTLPLRFNLIADYNHEALTHKGDLVFEVGEQKERVDPELIHVYHHWADNNWDVWKAVEERTGLTVDSESNVINALWIGNKLSVLELLTIHSFLKNGHTFKLWLYDKLENDLPEGVIVGDAAEIIPREKIFAYKNSNQYGHGKGSYAGFSDIFRYKLLYDHGGWWVDMDITCLKLFDFDKPYFFRKHHELKAVGNMMKCPRGSFLMQRCYEEAANLVDEHNTDWHKPIDVLNKHITQLQLENYIVKEVSNEDKWEQTSRLIWGNEELPEYWYFIHWQNEEWRKQKVDKTHFYHNGNLNELLCKYGLSQRPATIWQQWINELEFSPLVRKLKQLF